MRLIAPILALALAAGATTAQQFHAGEAQLTPQQALWAKISEVRFENASLRDSFEWVAQTLGTNLHVDWGALAAVDVQPDQPINLNLRWVRVPRLLRLMLQETGKGDQLTYYISGNILIVTTKEQADSELITRVYPVHDLVIQPQAVDRPDTRVLSGGNRSGSRGSSGTRSGVGGFGGLGDDNGGLFGRDDRDDDEDDDLEARGAELVEMIKKLTPADAWRENGGKSNITFFRGSLIVTAPRSIHQMIAGPVRE